MGAGAQPSNHIFGYVLDRKIGHSKCSGTERFHFGTKVEPFQLRRDAHVLAIREMKSRLAISLEQELI